METRGREANTLSSGVGTQKTPHYHQRTGSSLIVDVERGRRGREIPRRHLSLFPVSCLVFVVFVLIEHLLRRVIASFDRAGASKAQRNKKACVART